MNFAASEITGIAQEIHARHRMVSERREVVACTLATGALILGSSQPLLARHERFAREHGFDIARRASGGTGVVVVPGGAVWIDVALPPGDPLMVDDVSRSFAPVSNAWSLALSQVGVTDLSIYEGRMQKGGDLREVCFAGRGSGELLRGGRKLVGMSQRRSGHGAWFHTMAYFEFPLLFTAEAFLDSGPAWAQALSASVTDLSACGLEPSPKTALELAEAIAAQLSSL